jgi:hypothetical protein
LTGARLPGSIRRKFLHREDRHRPRKRMTLFNTLAVAAGTATTIRRATARLVTAILVVIALMVTIMMLMATGASADVAGADLVAAFCPYNGPKPHDIAELTS